MKTTTTLLTIFAAAILWSCNGISDDKDAPEKADSTNEAMVDGAEQGSATSPVAEADTKFAVDAANGGMAEVQLGDMAQTRGSSAQVKDFGKMMVADHTKANDELKALAAGKNITLPADVSEDKQKVAVDLSTKTGADFDKAYISQMVKDHKESVKLFEDGQKDVKDPEIKAFIDKTLPVLQAHLDHIKAIDEAK